MKKYNRWELDQLISSAATAVVANGYNGGQSRDREIEDLLFYSKLNFDYSVIWLLIRAP